MNVIRSKPCAFNQGLCQRRACRISGDCAAALLVESGKPAAGGDAMPMLPQSLLDRIGEYGMSRTDGEGDVDRLNRWSALIAEIKKYARSVSSKP